MAGPQHLVGEKLIESDQLMDEERMHDSKVFVVIITPVLSPVVSFFSSGSSTKVRFILFSHSFQFCACRLLCQALLTRLPFLDHVLPLLMAPCETFQPAGSSLSSWNTKQQQNRHNYNLISWAVMWRA